MEIRDPARAPRVRIGSRFETFITMIMMIILTAMMMILRPLTRLPEPFGCQLSGLQVYDGNGLDDHVDDSQTTSPTTRVVW